jgi:hypothetical protein
MSAGFGSTSVSSQSRPGLPGLPDRAGDGAPSMALILR